MLFLCLLILSAGCIGNPQKISNNTNSTNSTNATIMEDTTETIPTGTVVVVSQVNATDTASILRNLKTSVVSITYSGTHDEDFFGDKEFEYFGSGVVYSKEKNKTYVLTNRHMVDLNYPTLYTKPLAENITITTLSGKDFKASQRLIAPGLLDLAIIIFDGIDPNTTVAPFSGSLPQEGEEIRTIGMPEGLNWSISKGIISSVRKLGPTYTDYGLNYTYLQTDAAINPGNSGGGMFDSEGRLVGINSYKYGLFSEGLNFAISVANFSNLKDKFISLPFVQSKGQQYQAGPVAYFGEVDLGELNESANGFPLSIEMVDANGFPTTFSGRMHVVIKDNVTAIYENMIPVVLTDFKEVNDYPTYGFRVFRTFILPSSINKTPANYLNVSVDIETTKGKINKTETVFTPYELYPEDSSSESSYYNYGSATSGSSANLALINLSSTNDDIQVLLAKAGASYSGSDTYLVDLSITNHKSNKENVYISDAALIISGKQYSPDYYDTSIGNIYPGATVDQTLYFYDVRNTTGEATLYLTLNVYDESSYDSYYGDYSSKDLEYKFDFKP